MTVAEWDSKVCLWVADANGSAMPLIELGDIPLDGSWEVLHGGSDTSDSRRWSWIQLTADHHLAAFVAGLGGAGRGQADRERGLMPAIAVNISGDHERVGREAGTDRYPLIHTTHDWTIDVLEKGMASGKTSLMLIIPADVTFEDSTAPERILLMVETSLNAWMMATAVIRGHCAEEVGDPGWAVVPPGVRRLLGPRYAEAIRRAIPSATQEQAEEAAEMMFDSLAADRP